MEDSYQSNLNEIARRLLASDETGTLTRAMLQEWLTRKKKWPTPEQAMIWCVTELGEVGEILMTQQQGWVRNHPELKPMYSQMLLAEELGDVIYMALITGFVSGLGLEQPIHALLVKLQTKMQHHQALPKEVE